MDRDENPKGTPVTLFDKELANTINPLPKFRQTNWTSCFESPNVFTITEEPDESVEDDPESSEPS